jgi:hypothetical protein
VGYKFVLAGCTSAEKGMVIRCQIATVPIARELTGVRAFALMSPAHYFMKENGSATQCLSSRPPLF